MGIEVKDGAMANIIPRNGQIPMTKTKPFTTVSDDQETVGIRIFEGERPLAKHNHFLGEFDLTGIPLAPRGVPEIDVTFDIDVNGILNVSVQSRS
jgi:molecular chaperone DnaK (HSP70)